VQPCAHTLPKTTQPETTAIATDRHQLPGHKIHTIPTIQTPTQMDAETLLHRSETPRQTQTATTVDHPTGPTTNNDALVNPTTMAPTHQELHQTKQMLYATTVVERDTMLANVQINHAISLRTEDNDHLPMMKMPLHAISNEPTTSLIPIPLRFIMNKHSLLLSTIRTELPLK
jgi:hypothetical protein